MQPGSEDFESLQKLLALKRYEQPPPGYFDRFPYQVMARIEAEEARFQLPWWERVLGRFDLKPALVGAFGFAVMGVYFLGLSLANYVEQQSAQLSPAMPGSWYSPSALAGAQIPVESAPRAFPSVSQVGFASSMNPVMDAAPPRGLFAPGAGMHIPELNRVSFSVRGE